MSFDPEMATVATYKGNKVFDFGSKTYVMGIVNVSPESFSGDGLFSVDIAVEQASQFIQQGADIIDVGGQSTRPLSSAQVEHTIHGNFGQAQEYDLLSPEIEINRVVPVIEKIASLGVPISIDTFKLSVAKAAIEAGATIINDISGLNSDIQIASLAADKNATLILMHNHQGTDYIDFLKEMKDTLLDSIRKAKSMGVMNQNIIIDPGFGFGKSVSQNINVLRNLDNIKNELKYPLLLGTSRKSTLGHIMKLPVNERIEATAATVALGISKGVDIIRVHDVKYMARVAKMADSIVRY